MGILRKEDGTEIFNDMTLDEIQRYSAMKLAGLIDTAIACAEFDRALAAIERGYPSTWAGPLGPRKGDPPRGLAPLHKAQAFAADLGRNGNGAVVEFLAQLPYGLEAWNTRHAYGQPALAK